MPAGTNLSSHLLGQSWLQLNQDASHPESQPESWPVNGSLRAARHAGADSLLPGLSKTLKHRQFFDTTSFTDKGSGPERQEEGHDGAQEEGGHDGGSTHQEEGHDGGGNCQMPEKDGTQGDEKVYNKVTQTRLCELFDKHHYLLDKCTKSDLLEQKMESCTGITEKNTWHLWFKCDELTPQEVEKGHYRSQDDELSKHMKLKGWLTEDGTDPRGKDGETTTPSFQGDFSLADSQRMPVTPIHPKAENKNFCGIAHGVFLPSLNEHGGEDRVSAEVARAFADTAQAIPEGAGATQGLDLTAVVRKRKDGEWELAPQVFLQSHHHDLEGETMLTEEAQCQEELVNHE